MNPVELERDCVYAMGLFLRRGQSNKLSKVTCYSRLGEMARIAVADVG